MPLFRCLNEDCSEMPVGGRPAFDFEAATGVCPKCGHTLQHNSFLVIERATIHYLVSDPKGPMKTPNGNRLVACQPLQTRLPKHCTGAPVAVTCPACLASAVLQAHVAGNVVQDQPIMRDDATGVPIPSGPPE